MIEKCEMCDDDATHIHESGSYVCEDCMEREVSEDEETTFEEFDSI